jgi:hypothetical protein
MNGTDANAVCLLRVVAEWNYDAVRSCTQSGDCATRIPACPERARSQAAQVKRRGRWVDTLERQCVIGHISFHTVFVCWGFDVSCVDNLYTNLPCPR